ncbi:MAG: hypothetical protein ACRC2H_13925 [Silanimonas sp.]
MIRRDQTPVALSGLSSSWVPVDFAAPAPAAAIPADVPEPNTRILRPAALAPPAAPSSPDEPSAIGEVPLQAEGGVRADKRPRADAVIAAAATPASTAPVARTVVYLDDEARALLPHENLYSATPPPREGDYYTPGDGSEDDVFYRPRALDPNPSRFAYAWRPRGNLIDDWLARAVEKVSGKVTIPLNAKFSLVCGTVAGVAGGCAIVRNAGTGVIVQRPPPAPWERSNRVQCRELRQALEAAEEAAQVAYFLDRLSALCSATDEEADRVPDAPTGNDEARHEAGLPEEIRASGDAAVETQRDL